MPMRKVSKPDHHHGAGDQRLRSDPIKKNVAPVMRVETEIAAGAPAMNGSSGIEPHSRKARNVISAARAGERVIGGSPCSSVIIVSIQRSRVPVMTSTALSIASPEKPLASKI